jgi:hypothetical protein
MEGRRVNRRNLEHLATKVAVAIQAKPFNHWQGQQFPNRYQETIEGHVLEARTELLEANPDYLEMRLLVSSHEVWLSSHWPVRRRVIVRQASEEMGQLKPGASR